MSSEFRDLKWWQVGVLILAFPLVLVALFFGMIVFAILGLLALGAFYVGPVLGGLLCIPILGAMHVLGFSQASQDKVQTAVFCIVCPLCALLMLTLLR